MNGGDVRPNLESEPPSHATPGRVPPLVDDLDLQAVSRWPTRLSDATVAAVLAAPLPVRRAIPLCPTKTPRATIVVVTWDNYVFNRLCLESLLGSTQEMDCEILVVDNASTDGTAEYLQKLVDRFPQVRVSFNHCNMGFAASNNQVLSTARGECLVLLNNDTVAAPGWLPRLLAHLDDPRVGLVGPVTNRSGNEAQIEATYRTYGQYAAFAEDRWRDYRGQRTDIRVATMFCAAMRRDVFRQVGLLDERFEIGLFEDDDYCMRVRQAGYRVVCAEDVVVHHFGQASIGKLAAGGRYGELFHANRRRWEEKWRQAWEPYSARPSAAYTDLTTRMRAILAMLLPPGASVAIISKGDDNLLQIDGCVGRHFPCDGDGRYLGHHPADGAEAVRHLEAFRSSGGQFLVIPETSRWWLHHYAAFAQHLREHYAQMLDLDGTCALYCLGRAQE